MPICARFMAGRPLSERSSSRLSALANGNSLSIVLMNLTVFFCPPESAEANAQSATFDRLTSIVLEIVNYLNPRKNPLKSKAKSFDGLRVGKRPSIEGNMLVKSERYDQKEQ